MTRSILTALLVAAVASPTANAQQDEVFVDPDSPAGTEYAVPLDQARREATGANADTSAGGTAGQGGEAQPLFGVGIERSSKPSAAQRPKRGGESTGGGSAPAMAAPGSQSAAAIEAAGSDGSGGLLTAGIAAGVLAAGLLAGLGLRRLLRES